MEALRKENEELQIEVDDLRESLTKSAIIGQSLLSRNNELEDRITQQEQEFSKRLEVLEQDNYVLKNKLESKEKLVLEQDRELDIMRSEQQEINKRLSEKDKQKTAGERKIVKLEAELSNLQGELEAIQLTERNLTEKVERQKTLLDEWMQKANENISLGGVEDEVSALQKKISELEKEKDMILLKLQDAESVTSELLSNETGLKERVITLQEELEEYIEMLNATRNDLQLAEDKNVGVNQELQLLKLELNGNTAGRKGNSLFSEVEDRRVETEKRFISLKVKHESLQKAHSLTQQQLRKLKSNLQVYLHDKGRAAADSAHIQRLERSNVTLRTQVDQLMNQCSKLQKELLQKTSSFSLATLHESGETVPMEVVNMLQYELGRAQQATSDLKKRVDKYEMEILWGEDKLRETEGKLRGSELQAIRYQSETAKYQQSVQEVTEKCKEESSKVESLKKELEDVKTELSQLKNSKGRRSHLAQSSTSTNPAVKEQPLVDENQISDSNTGNANTGHNESKEDCLKSTRASVAVTSVKKENITAEEIKQECRQQ